MLAKELIAAGQIATQVQDNSMLVTEDDLWFAFEDALGEKSMPYERFLNLLDMLEFAKNAHNN